MATQVEFHSNLTCSGRQLDRGFWCNRFGRGASVCVFIFLYFVSFCTSVIFSHCDTFSENSTLTLMSMSENKIGDAGYTVLAKSMQLNTSLKIPMGANLVGDAGAAAGKAADSAVFGFMH